MATAAARTTLIQLTVAMFDAAPGANNLSEFVNAYDAGQSLANIANSLATSATFKSIYPDLQTTNEFAVKFINNLVGSEATDAAKAWAVTQVEASLNAGTSKGQVMLDTVTALLATTSTDWTNAKAAVNNQVDVATWYSVDQNASGADFAALQAVTSAVTSDAATVATAKATPAVSGGTFTLTIGADTGTAFTGGSANDTFIGALTTANTWSVGDAIDGAGGDDVFNVIQTAAVATPTGATVSNIETMNVTTGTTGNVLDTTAFSGLTALNMTGLTAQTVTAAATTAVAVTGSVATGATVVNGGSTVSVTETGANGGTVTIGGTTAAAGAVTVNSTILATGGSTGNATTVTGGTSVNVTQTGSNAVNTTVTAGAVVVTGNATTTAVTVIDDSAATAAAAVVGHVNGAVTITDANAASATAAGTITEATVTGGAAVVVNSGALTTLNIGGTLTTVNAGTLGALTTAANATLALNATGAVSTGAVTIDNDITTLNLSGNTTASTINSLVAGGVTTLNISGDATVTATGQTMGALTDVVVTNTAGASLGTILGTAVNFTGGAGADTVTLGVTTKAITMGDGDDTVTATGIVGTGGSVAAGAGTDTIILTTAQAAVADNSSTFNTKFTGFETLRLSDAHTTTLDLDGVNAATKVVLAAGSNGGTLNNLVSGGTVQMLATNAGTLTVGVKSALASSTDVLNLQLSKSGAPLVGNTITAANVETINVSTADAVTAGSNAVIHTATLTAADATSVVVSGNNGLALTATGSVAVTNFDASGVVNNDTAATATAVATTDTAANLAVTYTSVNTTANAVVTITGGAGNDTLTGSAAAVNLDTITGGEGADVITGGTGNDTINLTETTAAVDKVVFSGGVLADGAPVSAHFTANGLDTITGFGATDTLNVAALGDGSTPSALTAITTASAGGTALTTDRAQVITTDGTAANLTTGGTLTVTDFTNVTSVAAYLNEQFTVTSAAQHNVIVINDTSGTDTMSYVYSLSNDAADITIDSADIVLVGTVEHAATVDLTNANIVYA